MSFLPGFECDIFISYSHVDNRALTEGQKGWIDSFHQALEVRLSQVLGSDPQFFRDPKLAGNDYFESVLTGTLQRTAILVSIVSPRYVESEWCIREFKLFTDVAKSTGGLRVGDKSRIFKVMKFPVEDNPHPELDGLLGYEFFTWDPDSGIPRELSPERGEDSRLGFIQKVDDLALHIRELLKSFNPESTVVRRVAASGETIYLAETTYDLQEERDTIKRELEQRGHTVLPDMNLPHSPEFRGVVQEQLARAGLSVHLIGGNYSVIPESESESTVALQYRLAGERLNGGGFSRIVWMPPDLTPKDERQERLVEYLHTDPEAQVGTELLQTGVEELKTTIRDMLERRRQLAPPAVEAGGHQRIYLVCDGRDRDAVVPIEDFLFDQGFEVVLPAMEGAEIEIREDHKENLLMCDAVLIYCGAASEAWLRAQLRELMKAPGFGREKPMLARAIYLGAPPSPAKERFRTREAEVIRGAEPFSPPSLASFIGALRGSKADA